MSEIVKKSMANFLVMPKTSQWLEDTLRDKKSEFVSNMISLTDSDENLANCDPAALVKCAMSATALNLPLNKNLGYAYIIPYNNIPQFQIGYKGLIQLAIRTGVYETINACEIREGEVERNKITGAIKFNGEKPECKVVGYLAYLKLNSGFTASLYMSEAQIEAHALKYSKSYGYDIRNKKQSSKWSDVDARPKMALKTVLKGLLGTYGIMTTDMITAIQSDNENEDYSYSHRGVQDAEIIEQKEPETKKVKI